MGQSSITDRKSHNPYIKISNNITNETVDQIADDFHKIGSLTHHINSDNQTRLQSGSGERSLSVSGQSQIMQALKVPSEIDPKQVTKQMLQTCKVVRKRNANVSPLATTSYNRRHASPRNH